MAKATSPVAEATMVLTPTMGLPPTPALQGPSVKYVSKWAILLQLVGTDLNKIIKLNLANHKLLLLPPLHLLILFSTLILVPTII
jgi:hypothetical protein